MLTRLYFVRHGATQLTAEDRFSGATGVDLSDEGRHQVQRLAERLRGDAVKAIYTSPLGRTVETARILARPHRLTPILRDGLRGPLGCAGRGSRDRLDQSPACLNVVDFKDPVRARLMLFNDTSHYADRPRVPDTNLSKWWDTTKSALSD